MSIIKCTAVQNTNLNPNYSHGLSIVKNGSSYTVSKVATTYKKFLQKNINSHNNKDRRQLLQQ